LIANPDIASLSDLKVDSTPYKQIDLIEPCSATYDKDLITLQKKYPLWYQLYLSMQSPRMQLQQQHQQQTQLFASTTTFDPITSDGAKESTLIETNDETDVDDSQQFIHSSKSNRLSARFRRVSRSSSDSTLQSATGEYDEKCKAHCEKIVNNI
jgi:hypothetical protein